MEEYLREKGAHEQNRRQIQASMRTPGISDLMTNNQKLKPLPDDYFLNPETGQMDPDRILQAGRLPDDKQLKNLFLRAEVELYGAKTDLERLQAQQKLELVKDTLATLMAGQNGLINRDGYVIIGDQAYGQNEAIYKAMQDIEYFHEHGKHLPALKYPAIPPESVDSKRHREIYPNVTAAYRKELQKVASTITDIYNKEGRAGVYLAFKKNFPNNGIWDMQVTHNLPGQVILRDPKTKEPLPDLEFPGQVATMDQYAYFGDRVVKAGYLSNYIYGYAAAAGGLHLKIVQGVPEDKGEAIDNPDDLKAMEDGYNAYRREHPNVPSPRVILDQF